MSKPLTTAALIACLALPVHAGGPVIVEDAYEAEAPRHDRKIGGLVVGLIVIAALIAASGGSDTCNNDGPEPTPEPC